ncbi:MAG: peptide ABC transporter substrate-binding protein [Chloroflexi bacterium]|nr:peptide ABC transporter substrate-binding protein [Chloroflexota bacterium]
MKSISKFFVVIFIAFWITNCAASPTTVVAPKKGGTFTLAIYQEPDLLNPYLAAQRTAGEVHIFVIEGLLGVNEKGEFYPVLAREVPTKENGGLSADGLTLTYHLKENVVWSDGEKFTCDDVKFTWEAVTHPKSGAVGASDLREINSVECPDPYTVVIKFKNFYAAYLVPFWVVLPRHATGDPANISKWDYNRKPLGTGPFKIVEWVSGDHITLVRNERYREAGKPYLDSVLMRFVPSRDVALQLLRTGEVTMVWDVVEANLPQLTNIPGITIGSAPGPRSERLVLNLSNPTIDAADASANPHPILSDVRVRTALELAIHKREIVDKLLNGQAAVGTNELNVGWAQCNTTPSEFNSDQARKLLDDAGWKLGADGIRISTNGTRLRLKLQGPSGDSLREQVQQLLLDYWKAVGVEAYIENAPTAALLGTWDANSPARHGKFDMLIYTTGPYVDPQAQVEGYFASWNIPQASNRGTGYNYSRWVNAAADAAIRQASSTPDIALRRQAYCQVMSEVNQARPQIYLYGRYSITAYRDNLQNWKINVWKNLGWGAADWWLK